MHASNLISSVIAGVLVILVSMSALAEEDILSTVFTISQGRDAIVLNLEVVACAEQRSRGLQDRTHLADDAGMLFLIEPVDEVSMWMKDTYISLDIIFVDAADRIVGLVESAVPLSLRSINSPQAVAMVVEVNAGLIQRTGIELGYRVHYHLPTDVLERRCGFIG